MPGCEPASEVTCANLVRTGLKHEATEEKTAMREFEELFEADLDGFGEEEETFLEFDEDEFFDEGDYEFDEFTDLEELEDVDFLTEGEGIEEEDEFLGTLAGLAARALPRLASTIVPSVLKVGRRLLRSGSKRLVRRVLPRAVKKATRVIRRNYPRVRRQPRRYVPLVLRRIIRAEIRRQLRGMRTAPRR